MTTPSSTRQEVTQLLDDWSGGDDGALEKLVPLVQPELHRLAHHYMSRERAGHTLQTTAILNEAYLRLVDNTKPVWQGRSHFIAATDFERPWVIEVVGISKPSAERIDRTLNGGSVCPGRLENSRCNKLPGLDVLCLCSLANCE